jgi:hypothetical protein
MLCTRLEEKSCQERTVANAEGRTVLRRTAVVIALVLLAAAPAPADSCSTIGVGGQIVLKSSDLDPDVFVWDSKTRVADYAAGNWRDTRSVLTHTLLAKPGTYAQVIACQKDLIRSRYADETLDAVQVRLVSGPYHGRYGWVTSDDVHTPRKAALH